MVNQVGKKAVKDLQCAVHEEVVVRVDKLKNQIQQILPNGLVFVLVNASCNLNQKV